MDVSRKYINVCNCHMFSIVNVYHDHLKLCVLMVDGMSVVVNVMLSPFIPCNLHIIIIIFILFI